MNLGRALCCWLCAASSAVLLADDSATIITYAALPAVVQKNIRAQIKDSTLGAIERDEDDGEVTYLVEIITNRFSRGYTWNENGVLVGVELTLMETPPAVQKTILAQIVAGKLVSIDKVMEDNEVSYDVEWKAINSVSQSFSVLENGKLDTMQVSLAAVPAAVRATIANELGQAKLLEVTKNFDADGISYDVSVTRDGKERDFNVLEDGKVESRQLFISEVTAPAQKTIQRAVGDGRLLRIDQVFEKNKTGFPYEVESIVSGKAYDFSVNTKGQFLGATE